MYAPSDDTFLLADCIRQYSGSRALEIGVGSGLLLDILEKNFTYVAGSDIDLQALQHCKQQKTTSSANILLVCCDAGSAFGIGKFDLIVSNPPYLPNDDNGSSNNILDPTVHGGPTGIETTAHFINSALPLLAGDGKLLIVISSFANYSALDKVVLENNMHKKVVKEKRLFYETLSIVELSL
ncbi:MAG: methyltransferase [Thermoproteota archaeon]|nr:methyltransferase [Thermoproteota archaeon]